MSTEPKQALNVQVRWMIRRDMADVLKIEQESFEFPGTRKTSSVVCANATASAWSPSTMAASSVS